MIRCALMLYFAMCKCCSQSANSFASVLFRQSLERCSVLDETLSSLARQYHGTKFLRIRASAIGFATTESAPTERMTSRRRAKEDADEDDEREDKDIDIDVDTDMLPTILVYKAGELEFSWVRADWEAGEAGLGELLKKFVSYFNIPFAQHN